MLNVLVLLHMKYQGVNFRSIVEYRNDVALVGVYEAIETPFAPLILLILHEDGADYIEEERDRPGIEDVLCNEARVIAKCMEAKEI